MKTSPDWLLVIDMQPAFGSPDSPWFTPGYEDCAAQVARLVEAFADQVLFTRFVPPSNPKGSWAEYYGVFPFALEPQHRGLWNLDPRWQGRLSVTSHRFAKWHEAAAHVPAEASLVLCGVATDCCVLGTALEATDAGRTVRLVGNACAAGTDSLHVAALNIAAERVGQMSISDTDLEVLGQTGG